MECDSSVTTANVGQNCDNATLISGGASATGGVIGTAWSPAGLTMLVDGAYSDSAAGSCLTGASCSVAAIDSTNAAVNALSVTIGMATPVITIAPTTVANGNGKTITVTGKGFPINDTVDAVECDTAFSGSFEQLRHRKGGNHRYSRCHGRGGLVADDEDHGADDGHIASLRRQLQPSRHVRPGGQCGRK